jgi:hypothetical protein
MKVIAERILEFWAPGRKTSKRVTVRIGAPECLGGRDDWVVPIEIIGPGKDQIRKMRYGGVDAVQALVLTLAILPTELKLIANAADGKLTFFGRKNLDFLTPRWAEEPLSPKRKKSLAKKLAAKRKTSPAKKTAKKTTRAHTTADTR